MTVQAAVCSGCVSVCHFQLTTVTVHCHILHDFTTFHNVHIRHVWSSEQLPTCAWHCILLQWECCFCNRDNRFSLCCTLSYTLAQTGTPPSYHSVNGFMYCMLEGFLSQGRKWNVTGTCPIANMSSWLLAYVFTMAFQECVLCGLSLCDNDDIRLSP